jgi:hypothetical protein
MALDFETWRLLLMQFYKIVSLFAGLHILSKERNSRVEAGSNTSTVTLRVVGADEKGSLECETVKYDDESQVKYDDESQGSRTRK